MGSTRLDLATTAGDRLGCATTFTPGGWALVSACTADDGPKGLLTAGLVHALRLPSTSSSGGAGGSSTSDVDGASGVCHRVTNKDAIGEVGRRALATHTLVIA